MTPSMPAKTAVPSACRISAPGPRGDHQRHHAEDEGEGGHQDRPQPQSAGLDHGGDRSPRPSLFRLARELDDQDGVLGGEADQHDEPDLGEDIVVHARVSDTPTRADSRLIGTIRMMASGSDQLSYCAASTRKTNSTDKREDDSGEIAGLPLLKGKLRPFEAHALRHDLAGQFLHLVERGGRRDARRRRCPAPAPRCTCCSAAPGRAR